LDFAVAAGIAVDVKSSVMSKGESSVGAAGLTAALPGAGFAAAVEGAGAAAAAFTVPGLAAPGVPFIGAPQNGQLTASSSRTDCLHAGQNAKSISKRLW
jgi:hypothetical protein